MKKRVRITPRQLQVLRSIVKGLPNRQIAERLTISVRTVEVHRLALMRRLRVKNVAQLFRAAYHHNLIKLTTHTRKSPRV
ncbi:MAG: hypothetical protein C4534_00320 [Gaiellales bacterium]|nr:MAG: hypothetical protein C4534_00320 [Gaiellales bacterium]